MILTLAKIRLINELLPTLPVIAKEAGVNYNTLIKRMNRLSPELTTAEAMKLRAEFLKSLTSILDILDLKVISKPIIEE